MTSNRLYKSGTLKNLCNAYNLSLPTLKKNLRLLAAKLPKEHPDRPLLLKSGKTKMLPDQVKTLVNYLGEPEIPYHVYNENNG